MNWSISNRNKFIQYFPIQGFYVMIVYGYLFGEFRLIKDTHHDEVFIEANGLVIMENNHSRYTVQELIAIARTELMGNID